MADPALHRSQRQFKFVPSKGYQPAGEVRFDMFEADSPMRATTAPSRRSSRFGLKDPALRAIAEIVHDID